MIFGHWEPEIHNDADQQTRLSSAKKADVTPKSVNHEDQTAEFEGSGKTPYHTTLDTCTCMDFTRRKKPCKHIYRLALELGLIDGNFKTGTNKNKLDKDINNIMELIYKMEPEDQKTFYNCLFKLAFHDKNTFHLMPEKHPSIFVENFFMVPSGRKNTYAFSETIQYHKNRIYRRMHSKFIYTQSTDYETGIVTEDYQEVFDHNMDAYSLGKKPPARSTKEDDVSLICFEGKSVKSSDTE